MAHRELSLTLNANNFSLIWNSLHDREEKLLNIIEEYGEDSEEAALAGNDIIYLRLYKKQLKEKGNAVFFPSVFNLSEEPMKL